jgi:hypothetical protein
MNKPTPQKPETPACAKCGEHPRFVTSMMDSQKGRTFHMFLCKCGDRSWTSEKA